MFEQSCITGDRAEKKKKKKHKAREEKQPFEMYNYKTQNVLQKQTVK